MASGQGISIQHLKQITALHKHIFSLFLAARANDGLCKPILTR